jgi:hypothetical protein
VDSDLGLLGISAGSEPNTVPAQPVTSSVAILFVFGDSAVRQLGSSQKFVSPIDSRFSSPPPGVTRGAVFGASGSFSQVRGDFFGIAAPVSNVVGSFSLGASSSGVTCSALQFSSDMLPLQVSSSS